MHIHYLGDGRKTALQWRRLGFTPIKDSKGHCIGGENLWTNCYCQHESIFFSSDEVRPMTKEEVDAFRGPIRKSDRERKRRARMDNVWKREQAAAAAAWKSDDCPYEAVIIDTETTGLDPCPCRYGGDGDELLQVSIIADTGNTLFDSYIRPIRKTEWFGAEAVNGISPAMVSDAPTAREVRKEIAAALWSGKMIIGYNPRFDLAFLREVGIRRMSSQGVVDVMQNFAPIYGEWDDYRGSYRWQKLTTCARYYGFDYESVGGAHSSLADCKATLWCYRKMQQKEDAI